MPRVNRRPSMTGRAREREREDRFAMRSVAHRGYGLGERNPDTLPNGRNGWETPHENERNTAARRQILAWVTYRSIGAKYHH